VLEEQAIGALCGSAGIEEFFKFRVHRAIVDTQRAKQS